MSANPTKAQIIQFLIDERADKLRQYDDAYPDVGMGPSMSHYRIVAQEQLVNEAKIPYSYISTIAEPSTTTTTTTVDFQTADYEDTDTLDFESIICFGKHKGRKGKDIANKDPSYIVWLHTNSNMCKVDDKLLRYAMSIRNVLNSGKHPLPQSPSLDPDSVLKPIAINYK